MKRKFFFFIDRLQIKRTERITLSVLMVIAVFLTGLLLVTDEQAHYNEGYYAELDSLFTEKATAQQEELNSIMARYEPDQPVEKHVAMRRSAPDTVVADTTEAEPQGTGIININSADAEKLQELPGIGPAYARRIVEWREANGHFTSKEQLLEIRGIGPARLEAIIDLIEL